MCVGIESSVFVTAVKRVLYRLPVSMYCKARFHMNSIPLIDPQILDDLRDRTARGLAVGKFPHLRQKVRSLQLVLPSAFMVPGAFSSKTTHAITWRVQ